MADERDTTMLAPEFTRPVAAPAPVADAPALGAAENAGPHRVCPECGQRCKSPRGLGIHRRLAHGVKTPRSNRNKKNKGRRSDEAAAAISEFCASMANNIEEVAGLLAAYRDGLAALVQRNKALRRELLRSREEVLKLNKRQ